MGKKAFIKHRLPHSGVNSRNLFIGVGKKGNAGYDSVSDHSKGQSKVEIALCTTLQLAHVTLVKNKISKELNTVGTRVVL